MATLIEAMRTLIDRREALTVELSAIDAELAEARQFLGIEMPTAPAAANSLTLEAAIAQRVHRVEPAAIPDPLAGPIEKICALCGRPFLRRSNRQKLCVACRTSHQNRSVEELATAEQATSAKGWSDQPTDAASDARIAQTRQRVDYAAYHIPQRTAPGIKEDLRDAEAGDDMDWLLDRLAAVERERDEARTDVIRMAQTKVGDRCEHHREPLKVLEYYALKECPLCWMAEAKQAEAALLALRAAIRQLVLDLKATGESLAHELIEEPAAHYYRNGQRFTLLQLADQLTQLAGVADQDGPRHD